MGTEGSEVQTASRAGFADATESVFICVNLWFLRPFMRCLGLDYGTKRIGLSHGDEVGVATPLPALIEPDEARRWARLGELVKARRITDLVVGYPFNMDGSAGFKAKEVDAFVAQLKARFGLPVHLVDETLTSYEAEATIAKKARRGVRDSGLVDSRAATIVLQDFLDQQFPPQSPGQF